MAAWKTCKLGEVCVKIGSGATPLGGAAGYLPSGVAFIRSQNVYNLHFETDGLAHLSEAAARKLQSVSVERGDVLLNITGDSVARTCLVPERVLPARVSQHVLIIRADRAKVFPSFLSYQLASPRTQAWLLGLAVGRGASRNALTKEMVASLEISLPSLSEQERIAGVLGAYDDLIALNARRMALLEEAAHRLYRECFFANPVIMRTCEAEEVCNITIGKTPSRVVQDYFTDKPPGMTWISIADMEPGMLFLSRSSEYLTADAVRRSHIQVVPTGSVLLSFKLTIGRVAIAGEPLTTNEAIAHFRLPSPIWREYVYFYLRDFNYATLGSTSAIGTAINSQIVKRMPFAVPEELARIETFHRRVSPYFDAVGVLARENALLREARDGLLPRLLREA